MRSRGVVVYYTSLPFGRSGRPVTPPELRVNMRHPSSNTQHQQGVEQALSTLGNGILLCQFVDQRRLYLKLTLSVHVL